MDIITLIEAVLILSYYRSRHYWFAFYTGIALALSTLCYGIVMYSALAWGSLIQYVIPMSYILIGVSIMYGTALIFSQAGKQFWLKAAGIFIFFNGLLLVFAFFWITKLSSNTSERITQWNYLANGVLPILLILHFLKERSTIQELGTALPFLTIKEKVFRIAAILSWLVALPLGILLLEEAGSSVHWANYNFKKTKELAELFEARIFINHHGDTLRYRLLKPLGYDTSGKYPLVISLPYGGQPGTDTIRQIEGAAAAQLLSSDTNRKKYPAFIFVPNCPPGSGWGGIPGYPSVDSLVYEAITSLDEQYKIDPKRRYVTGISRGGYGTWNFICMRPDLFAAAIPICGGGNPLLAPRAARVAVWAFHGANDRNVPVNGSRNMIGAIRKAGGRPKYTEYANEGHNIGYLVEITPGLWDWLFAQQKK